jgi:Type II secretory pathway, component PulJ
MKKVKDRIRKKLRGKAGESLAEVLIALLIAALALTMLASIITSASKMLNKSKEKMQKYDQANVSVAGMNGAGTSTSFSLTEGVESIVLDPTRTTVTYYVNTVAGDTEVVSYKLD